MSKKVIAGIVAATAVTLATAGGFVAVKMIEDEGPTQSGLPKEITTMAGVLEWSENNGVAEEELKILRTGKVTLADYQRSHKRTLECMKKQGIPVKGATVNAGDGWSLEPKDDPNGTYRGPLWRSHSTEWLRCRLRHSDPMEHAHNFVAENRIADWLLEAINTCLTKKGIDYPENAKKAQDYVDANIKYATLQSCAYEGYEKSDDPSRRVMYFLRTDFGAASGK